MSDPCFVLVAPQMGENIGAAARVMANFGLHDLRLVAPRDGWPNPAAETMSAGALPDVVTARVFDTVEAAIADCGIVFATTARPREMEKPVVDAAGAVAQMRATQARAAILFGAERAGLPNEAVALADAILSYPVHRGFASLNLAQAVALMAHAWAASEPANLPDGFIDTVGAPASREELVGMMEHFEEELDRAGFFFPDAKRAPITQNLRNAFTRAGWTAQEVSTFRGAIKALAVGRGKARVKRED
ncbi:MAG TPA: RNA methyltransferase [Hyphomonadaceae bacterium]|jgi:tRNA/rRNA methyltransferase|nr:RNA methyltransferase [Hyphomonadaceae bacterium]HPN06900.1 RNA methyltransferase [Hyphomonadaceae bacterium]